MIKIYIHRFIVAFMMISSNASTQPDAVAYNEVANGFTDGIGLANAGDGSNRMFIVKKTGQILIWDGIQVLTTPFLDISGLISSEIEQGLLGLAFHPDYQNNGFFYVNYTNIVDDTVITRYQVSKNDANCANPNSAFQIIKIAQPAFAHNGGDMHFANDGYLYIATGDGGAGGQNAGTESQDTNSLLGKILRIDIDVDDFPADANKNYGNPASNPFFWGCGCG